MQKLCAWFNQYLLPTGVLLLLFFIPLYPKLPLIDIRQTWVYIRLEDFLVLAVALILILIQLSKRRLLPASPLTWPILTYWVVGGISLFFSILFIAPKLPHFFPHLAVLHYLRRIEYMILFFAAVAVTRNLREIRWFVTVFVLTVLGVLVYGFGQKFLGFPAFLTMNEEFAKGIPLHLSSTSRITSTFAGHYDLAAFLVFAIAILGSLGFGVKHLLAKLGLWILTFLAFILLLFTASRISFGVYLVAISTMLWLQKKHLLIIPVIIASILLLQNVSGASDRFAKTFRLRQIIYDVDSGRPIAVVTVGSSGQLVAEKPKSPGEEDLPIGSGYISLPVAPPPQAESASGSAGAGAGVAATALQPKPTPIPEEELRIALEKKQLFYYGSEKQLASGAGEIATFSGSFYLQKALVYDISLTTRIQGQWPRAWQFFKRNIFLGSGYSTLSLAADGDYLRALGETGIAGLATQIFIFAMLFVFMRHALSTGEASPLVRSLALGSAAGLVGLFLNAILIDVFEASKVAFTIWSTLGFTVGGLMLTYHQKFKYWREIKRLLLHPVTFCFLLIVLAFVFYRETLNAYFVADDFTWLRWAAMSYTKDLGGYFSDATGFFYRPLTKLYFFFGFAFFWLRPFGYHIINVLIHGGATALVYLLARRLGSRANLAAGAAFYFLILAIHHENVIWISGISNLAGSFFSLLSLYLLTFVIGVKHNWWWLILVMITAAIAMLFHEGMLFLPLILLTFGLIFGTTKRKWWSLTWLLLIPAYWALRSWAQALAPSGSYGINLRTLPWNIGANLAGYIFMMVFGPYTIEISTVLREFSRQFPLAPGSMVGMLVALIIGYWSQLKAVLRCPKPIVFWLAFSLLALGPYLGLGNITERYGYLASAGGSIFLVEAIFFLINNSYQQRKIWGATAGLILILGSMTVNWQQFKLISRDWNQAGSIAAKILLSMRKAFFPVAPQTIFVFSKVPVRIGRAWLFPVGLAEAHWHIFRDDSIHVEVVGTPEEALAVKDQNPADTKALIIEGDNVKEIYR